MQESLSCLLKTRKKKIPMMIILQGPLLLVEHKSSFKEGINLLSQELISFLIIFSLKEKRKEMSCGRLNASWKISSSAVDGQSFLVIDGSLLNKNKRKDWFLKNLMLQHRLFF